ncbi:TetR/AcrR family transcriptional regulator [Nonomuraea diastatica]|uniref:TetR/AcrR family transcriptional regulator n=1 Tax=Nonomuraea diastatica TaxID=1848329 RepID=A0A4R4X612_9ACTN|nr:TetR/AcrR family transcriptional regulator [Nonomuraea diastatica]TDD25699.1 TetR/AcrR family transcriptional regulator [Nonomuraea diastatica]
MEHTPSGRRRSGRPPKSEGRDTRARILDTALDGFAQKGYAATSIRSIAGAVGIQDSALYRHFPSKQAIFDTLMEEVGGPGPILDALADAPGPGEGPGPVLRTLVAHVLDAWDLPRARQFISIGMREGGPGVPLIAEGVSAGARRTLDELGKLFRMWQEAGSVRTDVPVDQLAWELVAPLAHIRMIHMLADSTDEARASGRRLAERHLEFFLTCVVVAATGR